MRPDGDGWPINLILEILKSSHVSYFLATFTPVSLFRPLYIRFIIRNPLILVNVTSIEFGAQKREGSPNCDILSVRRGMRGLHISVTSFIGWHAA